MRFSASMSKLETLPQLSITLNKDSFALLKENLAYLNRLQTTYIPPYQKMAESATNEHFEMRAYSKYIEERMAKLGEWKKERDLGLS